MNIEIEYRTIDRFPSYRFGSDGSVWSRKYGNWRRLKPAKQSRGYWTVRLNGRSEAVHRLILEAFVGPCPIGMEACHNDGNKDNNVPSNLRWDTSKNNHADRHGHGTGQIGERSPNAKLNEVEVLEILRKAEARESHVSIAREFHVSPRHVGLIVSRKLWRHLKVA